MRRSVIAAAVLTTALMAATAMVAAADDDVAREQAAAGLAAAVVGDEATEPVHDRALGLYRDERSGEYVIVVPSTGEAPSASLYAGFGLPVRIEKIDLTPAELANALEDVSATAQRASQAQGYSFEWSFDPRRGTIVVTGTAPASATGALAERHGTVVEYTRTNDPVVRLGRSQAPSGLVVPGPD